MYPTASNPLKLVVTSPNGKQLPSMKNDRVPFQRKGKDGKVYTGIRKSQRITEFNNFLLATLHPQWVSQGFDTIPLPHRVCVHAVLAKFVSKNSPTGVPSVDSDNQYTTLQEALMNVIPVFKDDRQVKSIFIDEKIVHDRSLIHATLHVWVYEPSVDSFGNLSLFLGRGQSIKISPPLLLDLGGL